jgi:hypothetical protein
MDGLDVYIDDYSKPDPIPPEMLSRISHARDLIDHPSNRVEPDAEAGGAPAMDAAPETNAALPVATPADASAPNRPSAPAADKAQAPAPNPAPPGAEQADAPASNAVSAASQAPGTS